MGQFWNIFLWLVVGFLVADYPLQLNLVFKIRYKYRFGGLLHVGIHFLAALLFVVPYLAHWQMWALIAATIFIHYFVDTVNKKNIFMFFADQAVHIGLIAGVAFLGRNLEPFKLPDVAAVWYFNRAVALYAIGYVAATFAGTIIIYFIKMTFRRDYNGRAILGYEKATGVLARAWVVTAVILGFKVSPGFYLAAPVPDLIRLYGVLARRGDDRHYRNVYPVDILISFLYAAAIGVALTLVK